MVEIQLPRILRLQKKGNRKKKREKCSYEWRSGCFCETVNTTKMEGDLFC